MSLVLVNIDSDFQITYVFNGSENVGSTKTMVSGTQVSQHVGFTRFTTCTNLVILHFLSSGPNGRLDIKKSMLLDKETKPFSNWTFSGQAEILRNVTLL